MFICFDLVWFWAIPGGAQGLLMNLCSGITSAGSVEESIWGARDQMGQQHARQNTIPTILWFWSIYCFESHKLVLWHSLILIFTRHLLNNFSRYLLPSSYLLAYNKNIILKWISHNICLVNKRNANKFKIK